MGNVIEIGVILFINIFASPRVFCFIRFKQITSGVGRCFLTSGMFRISDLFKQLQCSLYTEHVLCTTIPELFSFLHFVQFHQAFFIGV